MFYNLFKKYMARCRQEMKDVKKVKSNSRFVSDEFEIHNHTNVAICVKQEDGDFVWTDPNTFVNVTVGEGERVAVYNDDGLIQIHHMEGSWIYSNNFGNLYVVISQVQKSAMEEAYWILQIRDRTKEDSYTNASLSFEGFSKLPTL